MSKIALYFFDNQDIPRVLDTDLHPIDKIWRVGRGHGSDITFGHPAVSRIQAALRCRRLGVDDLAQWEIMAVGANPSYRSHSSNPALILPRNEWVALSDGDRLWFVVRECGFLVTTEIDQTLEIEPEEDDDVTACGPTAGPKPAAPEPNEPDTWVALAKVILNGPEGIPNALWWGVLLMAGVAIAILKYG